MVKSLVQRWLVLVIALAWGPIVGAAATDGVSFSIRLYDQQVYFPGDSVFIRGSIRNDSSQIYRFRFADERVFNLQFTMVDLENMPQPISSEFTIAHTANQPVYFRELSILPGEEFSFVENLRDYRRIDTGTYVVSAAFYPDLQRVRGARPAITSNRISVVVRPEVRRAEIPSMDLQESVTAGLRALNLPPDDVVNATLDALVTGRKDRYFLYLDLEQLYQRERSRSRALQNLSEAERIAAIAAYKEDLWNTRVTDDISRVPSAFEVVQTAYTPTDGTVITEQRYPLGQYTEIKRFTYSLQRRDGIWYIVDYRVENLGSE